jgi:molybdopterin-guanine dinucleotide biosynthesis protein A
LGRAKALEKVGNERLIKRVIDRLSPICQEILVVTSQEQFRNIASVALSARVVVDLYPGKAAFGGIYTGLTKANTFCSLVAACDMPFLNSALLRYQIALSPGFDIVIPKMGDVYEPLHAVYTKNCSSYIKRLLDEDRLQILELLNSVKTRYVDETEIAKFDPEHLSFFNINTRRDLIQAEILIEHNPDARGEGVHR